MQICFEQDVVVKPNPGGQEQFANDWKHFLVAVEGGWFSGKSFIGARKLMTLHQYNSFDENGRPTYVPSLIVAPTYGNAMDFCVPHIQDACEECGLSYKWQGSGTAAGGRYYAPLINILDFGTYAKPNVILIRTADNPQRITGFTVGAAWGDEPARWKADRLNPLHDAFIQMLGRVRDPKARLLQIMLTYTNEGDATRVYEEMHADKGNRALYRIPTLENPAAHDFYAQQIDNLTPELADQYLEGLAAPLRGGKVYRQFNKSLHVDSTLVLRRELPLQISLDFNRVPGVHLEVGQYHPDVDIFTVLYEIYEPRLTTERAALLLVALLKELNWEFQTHRLYGFQTDVPPEKILEIYGDATGKSEWTGTGQSDYAILCTILEGNEIGYRLRVPKSNPHVADRINAFNVALQDSKGRIHYKIHPRCKRLIEDLRSVQSNEFGEIDKTDRKLSHPSDAEGYRVEYIRPLRIESRDPAGRISVA